METIGDTPPQPWDGPELDWTEQGDAQNHAQRIVSGIQLIGNERRLPNADEVRAYLTDKYHAVPPDVDLDHIKHFGRALGINVKPSIIMKSDMPKDEFLALMRRFHIPWSAKDASSGAYFQEIEASIIYPPDYIPHGVPHEEVIAHEDVHVGSLPANIWNEGIARLVQQIYTELLGNPPRKLSPPFSVHSIGLVTLSNICNQDPSLFKTMLRAVGEQSVDAFTDFFDKMYALFGRRRFWHLSGIEAETSYSSMPVALRGIIGDDQLNNASVPLDKIMVVVQEKLAAYEARTGYSFRFPQTAAYTGAAAVRAVTTRATTTGSADNTDDLARLIDRVTQTMRVDDPPR